MKKPGLLKRLFSFGRKKEPAAESAPEVNGTQETDGETLEYAVVEPVSEASVIGEIKPDEIVEPEIPDIEEVVQIPTEVSSATQAEVESGELAVSEDFSNISAHAEDVAPDDKDFNEGKTDDTRVEELPVDPDVKLDEVLESDTSDALEPNDALEPKPVPVENPVSELVDPVEPVGEPEVESSQKGDVLPVVLEPVDQENDKPADLHITTKPADEPEPAALAEEKKSWFQRLSRGLSRTSSQLSENIASVFTRKKLDDEALEELEDILIQADLGVDTTMNIVDSLAKQRMGKDVTNEEVRSIMAEEIEKVLSPVAKPLELDLDQKPHVILVVGVNGSGKTTTIGKLSQKLRDAGFSSMLVAGDTFRAAAIEQLNIWGERTNAEVVSRPLGSDSSGLAFDAWQSARDAGVDVMMMDTAGRLQNKTELMAELEKIIRVLKKQDPTAPHTVLLTLDATTGQNALNQVEIFGKVAGVNGLIMTKLDGSARGGILVAISAKHQLPVYFIGVGEQVEDLEPFEARDFARSIAGLNS